MSNACFHVKGDGVAKLEITKRMYPMRYFFAPAEVVEFFHTYYGPTNRAFAALDTDKQTVLRSDLEQETATDLLFGTPDPLID